ncbi:MAG TPA: hypothetical protein VFO19_08590 [Vicinamibacterales bacterium]|nr:hypothetical protein [Vicinamibacterales bacterium]
MAEQWRLRLRVRAGATRAALDRETPGRWNPNIGLESITDRRCRERGQENRAFDARHAAINAWRVRIGLQPVGQGIPG